MDTRISIGTLKKEQWQDYRDIWLEALKESPEAFTATYEDQSAISDDIWKQRLDAVIRERDGIIVFALVDNKPIGMVGAYFEDNPKFRHIATVWGAYVKPEYRKQGVARDMANELFRRLQEVERIVKIKTYSITNGHLAVNVYRHFGFEIIGISKKELLINGLFYDVYIMEKFIR